MELIERPPKVDKSEKRPMRNEKYQELAEAQFKKIYDYLDALVSVIENSGEYVDTSKFEQIVNKVTQISSASNNSQYPSAKAVYDIVKNISGGTTSEELDDILTRLDTLEANNSNFATTDDLDKKQEKLTPGTNITIDENNVISAEIDSDHDCISVGSIIGFEEEEIPEGYEEIDIDIDYGELQNKPQIEGVELEGNKSLQDLSIQALTNLELEELINSQV